MSECPPMAASLAFSILAEAIENSISARPQLVKDAAKAMNNAETPGEDDAVNDAVAALDDLAFTLKDAFDTAARRLDELGGRVEVFAETPITSKCIRQEGRIAALMSDAWLKTRVEMWREISQHLEEKEGGQS